MRNALMRLCEFVSRNLDLSLIWWFNIGRR
nr:MAG TPA: hypothetical protein [Bacteriophage sp.]